MVGGASNSWGRRAASWISNGNSVSHRSPIFAFSIKSPSHSSCWNLTNVTLACEDINSKFGTQVALARKVLFRFSNPLADENDLFKVGQGPLVSNCPRCQVVQGSPLNKILGHFDDKIPSFYWNSSQAHDFKHISRVISNLERKKDRKSSWAEKIFIKSDDVIYQQPLTARNG